MTKYNPVFRSFIDTPEVVSVDNLRLSDLTGIQIILIQGAAADMLQPHFSSVATTPGGLTDIGEGLLACLTPAEYYLFGKTADSKLPSAAELNSDFARADTFIHATDLSHGKAVLKLGGLAAANTLSKICGLDFHDTIFPNMQAKQTSAAKTKTLIARCDEDGIPVYHLHVSRPFGQYFWNQVANNNK